MKFAQKIIGFAVGGLIVGILAAFLQWRSNFENPSVMEHRGEWRYNPSMDLASNPLKKAVIARSGLFALREQEVLYFVASRDSDGMPLSSEFDYELIGNEMDARYWSYTLYGEDYFLIPNLAKIYSVNMDNMEYAPGLSENVVKPRQYKVRISRKEHDGNWLPSGNASQLYINLRLYNPAPDIYNNVDNFELPTIRKLGI